MPVYSSYLSQVLTGENLLSLVKAMKRILTPHADKFDSIAFRGMSGALAGSTLAVMMKKTMLMVRKGEDCHSGYPVEGNVASTSYLVIDDLIDSGKTVTAIQTSIASWQEQNRYAPSKCFGGIYYLDSGSDHRKEVHKRVFGEQAKYIAIGPRCSWEGPYTDER